MKKIYTFLILTILALLLIGCGNAREDGVITLEESANIEGFIRRLIGRKA